MVSCYRRLIRNWHAKASEEDFFSKFVFEYLAFIAYLRTQLYESNNTDRAVIQKLKQNLDIKRKYLYKIQTKPSLRENWMTIKEELDKVPLGNSSRDLNNVTTIKWWNCSHANLGEQTEEEKRKPKGVISSLDDWENMVEFWHSIRNNLFHGVKNPEIKRDQFAVKYGYKTLKELMTILLYDWS